MPRTTTPILLSFVLLALAAPADAAGAGNLLVAPTRVVFEGRARTAEVTLVNTGTEAATYRISFVQLRMDENGGTKEIEVAGPGEYFSDALVRYSPREVRLEPNVAQSIRMQVRKPADLEPGEYRSHLRFRAVPVTPPDAGRSEDAEEMSVRLIPIYGVSIPVIVRQGDTSVAVTLDRAEVLPPAAAGEAPVIRFRVNRSGNQSVYGNFTVTFTPAGGKPVVVGVAHGVAVYVPNEVRVAGIPLSAPAGTALRHGVLRVVYAPPEKKSAAFAGTELVLP